MSKSHLPRYENKRERLYDLLNRRVRRAEFLSSLRKAYVSTVKSIARRLKVDDPDEARDLLHEVVVYLLDVIERGRRSKAIQNLEAFLVTSAINAYKKGLAAPHIPLLWDDLLEEGDAGPFENQPSPMPDPLELVAKRELQEIAWEEFWKLPPRQKAVVYLRCSGFTFPEIAEELGISESVAKFHYHVAVSRLRKKFGLTE